MKRRVPRLTTDQEADAFLNQNLADLDFTQFKPATFEFQHKAAQLNMRVPQSLLDAVKARARAQDIPYTRFIRQLMEQAVSRPSES